VNATTLPGKAEIKATPARRLINMDNLSGVFETVCPVGIDMDGLLLAGRQSMHRQAKMPWSFHEFWLNDLEHADGESAALTLPYAKGTSFDRQVMTDHAALSGKPACFFPGCQIGASAPDLVLSVWKGLTQLAESGKLNLKGLIARCCGVPAEWAGDEELFVAKLAAITHAWEELDKPVFILSCPSCMRVFEQHLPDIETKSIYEVLAETGLPHPDGSVEARSDAKAQDAANDPVARAPGTWAVFDPCAAAQTRRFQALRDSVRTLATTVGIGTAPLPLQESIPRCCGFGGQPDLADPEYAKYVALRRTEESDLPYLCYCSNCKDAFTKAGKKAKHILEILFPPAAPNPLHIPTVTCRRQNRERLKSALSGIEPQAEKGYDFALEFTDELREKMNDDRILETDVYLTVSHMRRTGRSVFRPKTGTHSGSLRIGHTTLWVETGKSPNAWGVCLAGAYGKDRKEIVPVVSVYSHRIAHVPEEVWNGVRRVPEETD